MGIDHDYIVIAVHGEGDRSTVNTLQQHRNNMEMQRLRQSGAAIPQNLSAPPDEAPDIIVVLRDEAHDKRIEHPVHTWQEVEQWKKMVGWDQNKRYWQLGAKVKVRFSV